ncbi:MAG: thiamine pyrophosphate-dependent enzyme [Paraburkholderia sp.]|jgi:acetolactate synthase-1/2/3 large subunit|uniref:thiamine pyrophosphate-dependent enzyme n=1 Tax=Paraburkholderia sp. TaxID=1926495 RepID=UPI003C4B1B13
MNMTGGQALAQQLVREGITDIFGIPGVQLDWAVEALRQQSDRIRYWVPRHEQATAYMADGYARTTGRIGVSMVVPGPGLLNAMAGLSTAYACNSRVLAITGNIHSSGLGRGYGLLHEIPNQTQVLASVTKWQGSAALPQAIPGLVREAVKQLRSGRPRPVGIEISHDVLSASADIALIDPPANEDDAGRVRPDPVAIAQAAGLLERARFPVIYAGGGVLAAGASEALRRCAEKLQAPVVLDDNAQGALSSRHPLALNTLGGRAVFPHADVVLVVGSRFLDIMTPAPSWPGAGIRYIYLNADAADWSAPRAPGLGIGADARLGLEALCDELSGVRRTPPADLDIVRAWAQRQADEIEPQSAYTRALRSAIPDDGILVNELTQVGYFARLMYPVYQPGTFITPGYQGTLGYGFATALGAAVGNPDRAVVSINGDGGFGWNMQELATARKYGVGLVTVVFNDGHFGNVRTIQKQTFGENIAVELCNPHFDRLASAFDLDFERVTNPQQLEGAVRNAIAARAPVVIEAQVGEMPSPWHLFRLKAPLKLAGREAPPNPLGEPAKAA